MWPVITEDRVMAGLKWAPEIRKNAQAVTKRLNPKAKALPKLSLWNVKTKERSRVSLPNLLP